MLPLLVCDDSTMARKQLIRALPPEWPVSITQASQGEEAMAAIRQGLGQVVLLDLTMPVMDGYQVLAKVREEGHACRIVVVSGDIQEEAQRRVAELGALGFIRKPAYYSLAPAEYQRHEYAQRDRSWTAAGIDIDALVERVSAYDRYVGASLRLIRAFGLRRKESVMFRPHLGVVPFEATGLPTEERQAEHYVRIKEGAKGGRLRFVPVDTEQRIAALAFAQAVVQSSDAHLGDPRHSLKRNLRRFDYVMARFGITAEGLGATAHGLRHEAMIDHYSGKAGVEPPVRGGGDASDEVDAAARLSVARLAGHNRVRASGAYLGGLLAQRAAPRSQTQGKMPGASGDEGLPEER